VISTHNTQNQDWNKMFGGMTGQHLSKIVDSASASTQSTATDGSKPLTGKMLDNMKIAEAGLSAKVAAGAAQGADVTSRVQAQDPGHGMGRKLLTAVAPTVIASAAAAATGMPWLGLVGAAYDGISLARAASPAHAQSHINNPHFRPVATAPSAKGSHHIGGAGVATPTAATGSFADYADRVRGVGSASPMAGGFGSAAKSRGPGHNVFEEKFAGLSFTEAEHRNNQRNLANVRQKIGDVQDLIAGKGMDATQQGVLGDAAWNRMDSGHQKQVIKDGGMMSLADTGMVSQESLTRFSVGSFEPRKHQQVALAGPSLG